MSLTDEQFAYYVEKLKEAQAITREAKKPYDVPVELVAVVFDKIASPLFYVSEKQEKEEVIQEEREFQKEEGTDREKRIAELKAMGYRETKNPDVFMLRSAEGAPAFIDIKTGRTWRGIR